MENGRREIGGPKHSNSKYASKVPFNVSTKVDTEESIQKKTLKKNKCWSRINSEEEFADCEKSIKT